MSQTEAAHEVAMSPENEYQDRAIKCVDCAEDFIWTAGEQVFFHDKGLKNEPKRCKPCKQAKNERLAAIAKAPRPRSLGSRLAAGLLMTAMMAGFLPITKATGDRSDVP